LEILQEVEAEHIRSLMEMQAEVRALKFDGFSATDGDSSLDNEDTVIQKNPDAETSHVIQKKLKFAEGEHAAALERNLSLQAKNDELEERAKTRQTDIDVVLRTIFKQLDTH